MIPQWVIEQKRDGGVLEEEDLRAFIAGYSSGGIPDYQMAALAMAVYFQGMTPGETAMLTDVMLHSGQTLDTSGLGRPVVDKHSTGGIGDKVSLVLAPLAACCGLAVPMISGRGLGITGGTLDKMESIPGFKAMLDEKELLAVVAECGCAIAGQTERLAPADRKLYALRDVTATVPSIPLITASILCKKLAEGLDALVLDVKWGRGAFMREKARARELAASLVAVGRRMGIRVSALLTAMDEPLGRTAGNALEVAEAVHCLRGEGPDDVLEVTLALAARMCVLGGIDEKEESAQDRVRRVLDSGQPFETLLKMTALQGGDPRVLEDPGKLPAARLRVPLPAPADGTVALVDAEKVGRAALLLGAGRTRTEAGVDHAVGLAQLVKRGQKVARGEPLAILHANDEGRLEQALHCMRNAVCLTQENVEATQLLGERLGD